MAINSETSATRLRIGIFLLLLWFLPFWLAAPEVANALGVESARGVTVVTGAIAIIQTIIGVIGALIAGKSATQLVKKGTLKQKIKIIWHVFWTGEIETDTV